MGHRRWTTDETEYLKEHWGTISIGTISANLGRSINSIIVRKNRLKLGPFLESGDYVSLNQISKAVYGYVHKIYKFKTLPFTNKKVLNNHFRVISLTDFWKWMKENHQHFDFSRFEENTLGAEPEWVKEKRRRDTKRKLLIKTTPWSASENALLIQYLKQYKYSYKDLSAKLKRSDNAIQRQIITLGLKERPVKAPTHNSWNQKEKDIIVSMIIKGYDYVTITAHMPDRSEKAIRNMIFRIYGTENLTFVRRRLH